MTEAMHRFPSGGDGLRAQIPGQAQSAALVLQKAFADSQIHPQTTTGTFHIFVNSENVKYFTGFFNWFRAGF